MVFSINRMRALGYYLQDDPEKGVKFSNECISKCPRFQGGSHAPGLADVLILLSEMYETLGYAEEALQSARLCVDVALNRLEMYVVRIDMFMFRAMDIALLLLSYSISSGALRSPDLLLSYSMITVALHNTVILIITHLSVFQPLNHKSTLTGSRRTYRALSSD